MGVIRNFLRKTLTGILADPVTGKKALADPILDRGGWMPVIREAFPGAWQNNVEISFNSVLSNWAVFSCMTLISSDMAKLMPPNLIQLQASGIWQVITNPAYSPVLRKPNHYQNAIQFMETWLLSKLTRGNTYLLKGRDQRGVVTALYPLDPSRVRPLINDQTAEVFYELDTDNLSSIGTRVVVPAREIIHDRFNCIFHPLVGTSPIFAAALAASQGLSIQNDSNTFFAAKSMPGGILTAPGHIDADVAQRIKESWDSKFGGDNRGATAVLGDGLTFQAMRMTAEDAQLIEQLKLTAEQICSAFHVPPYKIGVGPPPSYNNVQSLNLEYYAQCLQKHIQDVEACLNEGLGLSEDLGVQIDEELLLRMDSATQIDTVSKSIGAGFMSPNEARAKFDLAPVSGGESPYLQQQNFSLAALAKRDALEDPFGTAAAPAAGAPDEPEPEEDPEPEEKVLGFLEFKQLLLEGVTNASG